MFPLCTQVPTSPQLTMCGFLFPPLIDLQRLLHLLHLGQLPPCGLIIPQVPLVPHKDDGDFGTEVLHLRRPLLRDIF